MEIEVGVDSFIWSENFGLKDLYLFEKAKKMGFTTFDVFVSHPEAFPIAEVRRAAEAAGIRLVTTCVLNAEANPISPEPARRVKAVEFLKRMVDISQGLGSTIVGGVNYAGWGCLSGRPRTQDEWNWSVATLRQVAEYAQAQGEVRLAFEPVNRFETHFINTAEDAVKYCREIGLDNVGVHLDTFHMIREELSFTEAVRTCGKQYLFYVHVCENNRGIPGTGLVPWAEFFTALREIGYAGEMSIESFDPSFEEVNRLCAIWRKFAESGEALAEQGLANLKRIAAGIEDPEPALGPA